MSSPDLKRAASPPGRAQIRVRLSSPIENLKSRYDVVVVGSGYGGAIAASRMARTGRSVCLLERGKEFQPGEYPDTTTEAVREFQVDNEEGRFGPPTGLFDFRANRDMNVFQGCGLGGTSLVNANVALRAEPRVLEDARWPEELRADPSALEDGYDRAEEMLKPVPYPEELAPLKKLEAMKIAAAYLGAEFYRPPINVTFKDGVNHVGVHQQACHLCGDCVSGCNYGAKNTTLMNYLPDAHNHGAEIYTQVRVERIERKENRWLVHYRPLGSGREAFDAPTMFVSADVVILGGGALGSTEILLRSREAGLPLSDELGRRFTGNGDVLGFAYNTEHVVNSVGFGDHAVGEVPPVGPCIAGIIDIRGQPELDEGMVIEEGVAPGGISVLLARVFPLVTKLVGKDTDEGAADFLRERAQELETLLRGAYRGALQSTLIFLVMTHDDGAGQMVLRDGRLRIDWPGVGSQQIFQRVHENLQKATVALGGKYVKNPVWSRFFHQDLVTVHPLGGCVMGDDAARGVVNHKGQVFAGTSGTEVHEGLYVCDGSIVPRPLGVNPLLTISALTERCCALLARDRGWQFGYDLPSRPRPGDERPIRPGIQFTERMRGFFSTRATDDYEAAEKQGRKDKSPFEFTLTIVSDDLDSMLKEREHSARILGTVSAPALSKNPLTVTEGEFNLFVADAAERGAKRMRYRMKLTSEEGETFYFDGFKRIHDDPGLDMWADTTTLFVTVHRGESEAGPVAGRGILRIQPQDFLRQMTTMRVTDAVTPKQRLAATGRYGAFFTGTLEDVYGVF